MQFLSIFKRISDYIRENFLQLVTAPWQTIVHWEYSEKKIGSAQLDAWCDVTLARLHLVPRLSIWLSLAFSVQSIKIVKNEPDFFKMIITIDESWSFACDLETKQPSVDGLVRVRWDLWNCHFRGQKSSQCSLHFLAVEELSIKNLYSRT